MYRHPPYVPTSSTANGKLHEVRGAFDDREQRRLASIAELYGHPDLFTIHRVQAGRRVAVNGSRAPAPEVIIIGRTNGGRAT